MKGERRGDRGREGERERKGTRGREKEGEREVESGGWSGIKWEGREEREGECGGEVRG